MPPAYTQVVRQMIHSVVCSNKVIVVAEEWPCWLDSLFSLNVPVQAAYITKEIDTLYPHYAHWLSPLSVFEAMVEIPEEWHDYVILGSGSHDFLRLIMPKLRHHVGPFIYANEVVFANQRTLDLMRLYKAWGVHGILLGLHSITTTHAEFGGVTSACHMISFHGVSQDIFTPKALLP